GKVIYRCRMPSTNASARCGYWIAYEPDVLPYVIQNFLKQVTEDLPDPEPPSDELHVLGSKLQSLDNDLEQASERFLKAPKHLASRLLAVLEKMQAERDEVAAKVKDLRDHAHNPRKEWLERFRQEFFTHGHVAVSAPEKDHAGVDGAGLDLTGLENIRLV